MIRVVERFGDDIALECDVARTTANRAALPGTRGFINRPTDRVVIHDGMIRVTQPDAVHGLLACIAEPETHESHVHIRATRHAGAPTAQTKSLARCGLAGNRDVTIG